jgi:hypothetical protein
MRAVREPVETRVSLLVWQLRFLRSTSGAEFQSVPQKSPRLGLIGLFAMGVLLASSCAPPQQSDPQVFTEHRFLIAAGSASKKHIGQDCSISGASECETELCLHVNADPNKGHVCSRACESDDVCPATWACRSIYPAPGSTFCVPPRDWRAKATIVRPTAARAK